MEGPQPRIVALGTAGAPAPGRLTTTFLLSGGVMIDTGAAAHGLDPARRAEIDAVVLSHSHLDHTLGLPFLLGRDPLAIHGPRHTLDAVREDLLDGRIWPDLSGRATWHAVAQADVVEAGGWEIEAGPADHTVPCASYFCRKDDFAVAILGDTRLNGEVVAWTAERKPDVCIAECSFEDALAESADRWGHQTPRDLRRWREALGADCRILVTHIKPLHDSPVRAECEALNDPGLSILQDGDVIQPA
ncbi:MAG: MBL fold metallo-hydrolase [Planctomycetota bacterium]